MWLPLWREDVSVVCNCCWLSPAQSFSNPNSAGLTIIFYCLRREISPTLKARPPYLDSQGTGWPSPESESLYDWRFTANQLVLAPSLLRLMTKIFSVLSTPLWREEGYVFYEYAWSLWHEYRTYSMILRILPYTIYTSPLSCIMKGWYERTLRFLSLYSSTATLPACSRRGCRSQWPRDVWHKTSSLARTLGSWVPILLKA
jgi:hypothetical protein